MLVRLQGFVVDEIRPMSVDEGVEAEAVTPRGGEVVNLNSTVTEERRMEKVVKFLSLT